MRPGLAGTVRKRVGADALHALDGANGRLAMADSAAAPDRASPPQCGCGVIGSRSDSAGRAGPVPARRRGSAPALTQRIAAVSPRLRARIAGGLYLVLLIVTLFAASFVRGETLNEFRESTTSGQKEKTMRVSITSAPGRFLRTLLAYALVPAAVALAQETPPAAAAAPPDNPLSAHARVLHRG